MLERVDRHAKRGNVGQSWRKERPTYVSDSVQSGAAAHHGQIQKSHALLSWLYDNRDMQAMPLRRWHGLVKPALIVWRNGRLLPEAA